MNRTRFLIPALMLCLFGTHADATTKDSTLLRVATAYEQQFRTILASAPFAVSEAEARQSLINDGKLSIAGPPQYYLKDFTWTPFGAEPIAYQETYDWDGSMWKEGSPKIQSSFPGATGRKVALWIMFALALLSPVIYYPLTNTMKRQRLERRSRANDNDVKTLDHAMYEYEKRRFDFSDFILMSVWIMMLISLCCNALNFDGNSVVSAAFWITETLVWFFICKRLSNRRTLLKLKKLKAELTGQVPDFYPET